MRCPSVDKSTVVHPDSGYYSRPETATKLPFVLLFWPEKPVFLVPLLVPDVCSARCMQVHADVESSPLSVLSSQ